MKKPLSQTRVVSLVPSLTETLWDLGVGDSVVGVTKFCVHPAEARGKAFVVGGTKDPDLDRIFALEPDLVLADEDENKPEHLAELEEGGFRVLVSRIQTVADAARHIVAIGAVLGRGIQAEGWQQRILERLGQVRQASALLPPLRVFIPIWRKPLMSMSGRTYMSDLVAACGGVNVLADSDSKYFEADLAEVRAAAPEAVLLPTEPFRFRDSHRAEFADLLGLDAAAVEIVDGQAMTWFGTRTLIGLDVVAEALGRLRSRLAAV